MSITHFHFVHILDVVTEVPDTFEFPQVTAAQLVHDQYSSGFLTAASHIRTVNRACGTDDYMFCFHLDA